MDNYIVTGPSSAGKAFFLENYNHHFENTEKNKLYPDSIPTRIPSFCLTEITDLTGYIFEKNEDEFKVFNPEPLGIVDLYSGNRENEGYNHLLISQDYPDLINKSNYIFLVRDPRIIWFVDDHLDQTSIPIETLINSLELEINEFLEYYKFIISKNNRCLVLRFEDYQNNFDVVSNQINNFLKLKNPIVSRSSLPANYWISNLDYWTKIYKSVKLGEILSDDILDEISNKTKNFLKIFNYKEKLYIKEILINLNMEIWLSFKRRFKVEQ